MLFRPRKPLHPLETIWRWVKPRPDVSRSARYLAHRLSRMPHSSYSLAAGFACGAAVSFTPYIGLHFLLAAGLASLMRANVLASALGTVLGNPWTFPFIWLWIFKLGNWIIGNPLNGSSGKIQSAVDFMTNQLWSGLWSGSWEVFMANLQIFLEVHFLSVFLPMLVGGMPTAVVVWFAVYWPLERTIAGYQAARRRRLRKKRIAAQRKERASAALETGRKS